MKYGVEMKETRTRKGNPEQRSIIIPQDLWDWITKYGEGIGITSTVTTIRMILTEFRSRKEKEAKEE